MDMDLYQALEVLHHASPRNGGSSINLKKHPRAFGSGLAPFEVESTVFDEARQVLDAYIEGFPPEERAAVKSQLLEDFHEIRAHKEARSVGSAGNERKV